MNLSENIYTQELEGVFFRMMWCFKSRIVGVMFLILCIVLQVTMILYEVLRLYPPAIFLARRTYKAMELGGIRYPAGVNLMLPLIFIHHDPDIWGKDASEFNPQRFADGISNAAKHPAAFFPFGGGPRICIGQNFALLEAKMALSTILQRFSFELSPSYIHAPYTVLILQPQHGAQIRLKKIWACFLMGQRIYLRAVYSLNF